MLAIRTVKTAMVASAALMALLVALNNVTDYDTNLRYVRHTLTMDTTAPGNGLMWRAVTWPPATTLAFGLIILVEAAIGIILAWATWRLAVNLNAAAARFNAAKRPAVIGLGLGFVLWFAGFMVIGGEWFAMWQSPTWNVQQAAFRYALVLLVMLVFLHLPDGELDA